VSGIVQSFSGITCPHRQPRDNMLPWTPATLTTLPCPAPSSTPAGSHLALLGSHHPPACLHKRDCSNGSMMHQRSKVCGWGEGWEGAGLRGPAATHPWNCSTGFLCRHPPPLAPRQSTQTHSLQHSVQGEAATAAGVRRASGWLATQEVSLPWAPADLLPCRCPPSWLLCCAFAAAVISSDLAAERREDDREGCCVLAGDWRD
jgi:hypothetical protein